MKTLTHLSAPGGDGSVALCGVKFPENVTYLVKECTCPKCLELAKAGE